ncbi:MAG TPA: hypothetical protein VMJ30_04515 [Gemmatimonadales bacterium]|nr:hypothetical protein [Gemmatimonadales bacterium]
MTVSGWWVAGALVGGLLLQGPDLGPTAEQARRSLQGHDVSGLLGSSSRILLQLPTVAPSAPISRAHATALLTSYLGDFEEVTTEIRSVAVAGERTGTVELRRSYRVPGTQAIRVQSVLLAYALAEGRWDLTEIRISG